MAEFVLIARSDTDGPLVQGIGAVGLDWFRALFGNRAALARYVNQTLLQRLTALPEGTPFQVDIRGWNGYVQRAADAINGAWALGEVVDPDTGQPITPWPDTPGQIAWADPATDRLTLRVVKMGPEVLWLALGAAVLIIGALVWALLSQADYQAGYVPGTQVPAQTSGQVLGSVLAWLGKNWGYVVLGLGVAAAIPIGIRLHASYTRAKADETAAQRELEAAEERGG